MATCPGIGNRQATGWRVYCYQQNSVVMYDSRTHTPEQVGNGVQVIVWWYDGTGDIPRGRDISFGMDDYNFGGRLVPGAWMRPEQSFRNLMAQADAETLYWVDPSLGSWT